MLENIKTRLNETNALVLGDVILDKYYHSEVQRISPEAPVPIARFRSETFSLGGAANVARNLANLGVRTTLVGRIGSDHSGEVLHDLCNQQGIELKAIPSKNKTVTKIRVLAKNQQLLRLDFEDELVHDDVSELIVHEIKSIDKNIDLILASDYGKGFFTEKVITALRGLNKYVSVDSKPQMFPNYAGFSLLKPNFHQAKEIAKGMVSDVEFNNTDQDLAKMGKILYKQLKSPLLITRSEMGATFCDKDSVIHASADASDVVDVTGAGDTCLSIFSILDYLNIPKPEALEITNSMAKLTVSHLGTYAPTCDEFLDSLFKSHKT